MHKYLVSVSMNNKFCLNILREQVSSRAYFSYKQFSKQKKEFT